MSVNYYDKDNDQLTKLAGSSALVMDSTPSSGSTNPVTSNGIYEALATKQNTLSFDSTPTASSTNPVTSGGVKTALDEKLAKSTISDAYNSATQYGIEGNSSGYPTYCINNDVVYECISACIGVAPPNATYWKAHPLAEWIGELNSNIATLNSDITTRFSNFASDLNDLINAGSMAIKLSIYSYTSANIPTGNNGIVITQGAGTYRFQIVFEMGGEIYTRLYNNGTISAWVKQSAN